MKVRPLNRDDIERVSEFLRSRGVEASPDALKLLFSSRRFYGVLAEAGSQIVGLLVTDPKHPPHADEAYGVRFLEPITLKGYESLIPDLIDGALRMVPIGEVTVISFRIGETGVRSGVPELLLDRGFSLSEPVKMVRVIA